MPSGIRNEPKISPCKFCGEEFSTLNTRAKYCSSTCAENARKRKRAFDIPRRMRELATSSKHRAKAKSIAHNIDGEYLLGLWETQGGCCIITGVPFDLAYSQGLQKGWSKANAPSLDRIVPDEGYTKGNVRLTTFQVNCAMGVYTDEQFYQMCQLALERRK